MEFEWDEAKRQENLRKHSLDFVDAEFLFNGPMLSRLDTREDYNESRWVGIGFIESVCVVVAFTERRNGEIIRIISLRKALNHERETFEKTIKDELG